MTKSTSLATILVVDDSSERRDAIAAQLTSRGYRVLTAAESDEAIGLLEMTAVDLVMTGHNLPHFNGLGLVRYVHNNLKDTEVIVISAHPSISGAVEAVQYGACDYLAGPVSDEILMEAVAKATKRVVGRRSARDVASRDQSVRFGIVGRSDAMHQVFRAIEKAASTSATVLITGESGTGKELVARAIHYTSRRAAAPFVPVNCGGIPEGLLESELFGHVRGAFTGAIESRAGFFQTADGGTIFLDEISETSLPMQVKLLRVLQDKEVGMVGDSRTRKVDIRIVAATNKNLQTLVAREAFREDLFFRLSVITINVPPLRERGDDILILAHDFAVKFAREYDKPPVKFSDDALRVLTRYFWPGNVRELENIIQRLVVMADSDIIDAPDLPTLMRSTLPKSSKSPRPLAEVERDYIREVLAAVGGNKTRAAELLGIDRKTLREKLKE
ncbi:MAG: sigma-54 dependent transcriptional regulator [candidate division Zixibacteria bacterium]|nr:sigma-54 dependent transcriptional regulator [candidate division Zixibacteria bacterium]